jgi:hypothetical protein
MPIIVIFSLFREKLDRKEKSLPVFRPECLDNLFVIQRALEGIRFPPQTVGRMGIRIGDERDSIKGREPPVHFRIRGEPCLDRVNEGDISPSIPPSSQIRSWLQTETRVKRGR